MVVYLRACFPSAAAFLSEDSERVIVARFVGRERDDVAGGIDRLADSSDKISVRALLEYMRLATKERTELEEHAARQRTRLQPAPPPEPQTDRQQKMLAARCISALTALRMIPWTERDAVARWHELMRAPSDELARYAGELDAECHRQGKMTFGEVMRMATAAAQQLGTKGA